MRCVRWSGGWGLTGRIRGLGRILPLRRVFFIWNALPGGSAAWLDSGDISFPRGKLIDGAALPGELSCRSSLLTHATHLPRSAQLRMHYSGYAAHQAGKQDGPHHII